MTEVSNGPFGLILPVLIAGLHFCNIQVLKSLPIFSSKKVILSYLLFEYGEHMKISFVNTNPAEYLRYDSIWILRRLYTGGLELPFFFKRGLAYYKVLRARLCFYFDSLLRLKYMVLSETSLIFWHEPYLGTI